MKQKTWHLPLGIAISLVIHLCMVLLLNGGGRATTGSSIRALPVEAVGVEMETYPIFHEGSTTSTPLDH